jgi:FkbM family methyltransferase
MQRELPKSVGRARDATLRTLFAEHMEARTQPPRTVERLTPEQALHENGFYAVRSLLPEATRTALAAKLHAVANKRVDGQEWMSVDCVNRVSVVGDTLFDARIHQAVRAAIGPDIRFLQVSDVQINHDHLNWHRDSTYRGPSAAGALDWDESRAPYRVIKILIYLESENAGLAMLPGTHRTPPLMDAEHVANLERAGKYTVVGPRDEANRHFSKDERALPLMFCASPGDALIFDERLYHCGRRMNGGRVARDAKGKKLTLSYVFGADNVHSARLYSYFRYLRKDLGYRDLSPALRQRLQKEGLALSTGWSNHFESAPAAEREGLFFREPHADPRTFEAFGYTLVRSPGFERLQKERQELKKQRQELQKERQELLKERQELRAKVSALKAAANKKPKSTLVPCVGSNILRYIDEHASPAECVESLSGVFEDEVSRQTLHAFLTRLRAMGGHQECREAQSCDVAKLAELTALDYERAANELSNEQQRNHCGYGIYVVDEALREAFRGAARGKVAIDGGAYDGLTALMLLDDYGAASVHAFEPISFEKLATFAASHPNIVPVEGGLYSEYKENVSFTYYENSLMGATMRAVTKDKVDLARVYKLDDYVREHALDVGCIKLDVEGAEYDVIIGAEQTIRQQKPLLLISVYHTGKDLFEIVPLLQAWRPDYRFFMRHIRPLHADRHFHSCEYVIYAL